MFKILDPLARATVALESDAHRPIGEAYCKAEQKNTLKQTYDWGEEFCENEDHPGAHLKRNCPLCWAELEKEGKDV